MPESNVTVGAIFSSRRYNVGISEYVENGRVTADKLTAQMGQIVSFTLMANEGYKLRSISVRDASNNGVGISTVKARTKYMFVMPASDVTLGASFVPESVAPTGYTVDISSGIENGIVTADKLTAQKDETVTLTLSASAGYEFDSISVKDASNNSVETTAVTAGTKYTFVMPESNVTVSASFTPKSYTVGISAGIENGSVSTDKLTAQKNETVTLTLTANAGYKFGSISVKDASNNSVETATVTAGTKYTFVMPESNVTVSASFSPDTPIETSYTVLDSGTTGTMGTSGTYVLFGYWPQTIKADSVTVDETNSKLAGAYTYYKGSDGAWYAKIKENANQPDYKYSDGTTVAQNSADSYKYFKVEPIKWRVLTDNYSGKRLLLAESILVNHRYAASSNNYANSEIREYLNDTFWNTAFTDSEKSMIDETDVDNSAASTNPASNPNQWISGKNDYACGTTKDKIFLLSKKEVTTSEYGFTAFNVYGTGNSRIRMMTDFAKASGASYGITAGYDGGLWWLRSPYYGDRLSARSVRSGGDARPKYAVYSIDVGVCPALTLKN
jgi:hypothetical protein